MDETKKRSLEEESTSDEENRRKFEESKEKEKNSDEKTSEAKETEENQKSDLQNENENLKQQIEDLKKQLTERMAPDEVTAMQEEEKKRLADEESEKRDKRLEELERIVSVQGYKESLLNAGIDSENAAMLAGLLPMGISPEFFSALTAAVQKACETAVENAKMEQHRNMQISIPGFLGTPGGVKKERKTIPSLI